MGAAGVPVGLCWSGSLDAGTGCVLAYEGARDTRRCRRWHDDGAATLCCLLLVLHYLSFSGKYCCGGKHGSIIDLQPAQACVRSSCGPRTSYSSRYMNIYNRKNGRRALLANGMRVSGARL